MQRGMGKRKGNKAEREVCRELSKWITGGQRGDCFWRSAMSGGRATLYCDVRQCGDIAPVSAEGCVLTDMYFIENKFVRDLHIAGFVFFNRGYLADYWRIAKDQAKIHHKLPMLIVQQNFYPRLVLVEEQLEGRDDLKFNRIQEAYCYLFKDMTTKALPPKGRPRFI